MSENYNSLFVLFFRLRLCAVCVSLYEQQSVAVEGESEKKGKVELVGLIEKEHIVS